MDSEAAGRGRLLAHVWIDWAPDAPPDLFAGRTEGFLAPLSFAGDTQRLAFDGTEVLLTMTYNPEGKVVRFTPGIQFGLDALRFKREDIVRLAQAAPVGDDSPEQTAAKAKDESASPRAVFRGMENLTWDEISIAFVGDTAESGSVTAHNQLDISARGVTRRVGLETFGLVDRRRSPVSVNKQGTTLWGFAQRHHVPRGDSSMPQAVSRLGKLLSEFLGIDDSPFELQGNRWVPRCTIVDKRGAADERAKRDAERRTVSYERSREAKRRAEEEAEHLTEEQGAPLENGASQDYPFDRDFDTPENDLGTEYLKKYDKSRSA